MLSQVLVLMSVFGLDSGQVRDKDDHLRSAVGAMWCNARFGALGIWMNGFEFSRWDKAATWCAWAWTEATWFWPISVVWLATCVGGDITPCIA